MAEVESTRDGAVQTITLNRPETLNAFTRAVHDGLRAALKEARDPEVRAVVITGAGRGFCSGQDLTEFGELPDVGAGLRATYHPNVLAIRALEKPVIAAVNGVCAGAGLSLACACDLRIASDAAFFVPGFAGIGLVPDAGGTYFVQRLLGTPRAFEWMASNRRLAADEAHAWGLVSEVVAAGRVPGAGGRGRRGARRRPDARDRDDQAALRPRRDRPRSRSSSSSRRSSRPPRRRPRTSPRASPPSSRSARPSSAAARQPATERRRPSVRARRPPGGSPHPSPAPGRRPRSSPAGRGASPPGGGSRSDDGDLPARGEPRLHSRVVGGGRLERGELFSAAS